MIYMEVDCENCAGDGVYTVYNAYDPESKETCVCEICKGTGKVLKVINTRKDDDGNN